MLTKLKPLLLDDYGACIDVSGYNRDSIVIKKKR
jgi:hypothetical protein